MSRDQLDELMQPLPKIEGEDMGALSTRQGAKFDQMIEYVEQSGIPPEDAGGHIWESQVDYWKTIAREIAKTFCPGMRVHSQGRADNWARIEVKNKAMLAMLAMLVHDGEVSSATSGWDRVEGLKEKNFIRLH